MNAEHNIASNVARDAATWGKISDDELDIVEGRRELLVGKLQTLLGLSREEADRCYQEFERASA